MCWSQSEDFPAYHVGNLSKRRISEPEGLTEHKWERNQHKAKKIAEGLNQILGYCKDNYCSVRQIK